MIAGAPELSSHGNAHVSDMDQYIAQTPLARRIASRDDLMRPSAVHCFRRERAAASQWFRSQTGRLPERLVALDGRFRRWRPLPPPEANLQVVVFGERLRAKATRLAMTGTSNLLYAADPGLRATRTAPRYLEHHRSAIEQLWTAFEDDESRRILAAILRQRITGELGYLRVSRFVEYFHPIVKAEPGDVVVDAGAFNGATSAAFARAVGRSGQVFAFEPSRANRELIRRRLLRPWNWGLRIDVVPAALSDAVGTGFFEIGRGGSGRLREGGADAELEAASLTTLDQFSTNQRRVDLISLDIEGAEPRALAGAERLIQQQRPKLQISIYHSLTHLFELPLGVLRKYPDYALFLGHHDVSSTETDAYLIPRERLAPAMR